MATLKLFSILTVCLLTSCLLKSQNPQQALTPKYTKRLMHKYNVPGISIGIWENGKARFYNFGLTTKDGSSIDENSIFQAASLGKPLFAYSALKTQSIKLYSNIDHPSPLFKTNWGAKIKLDHLLSHSSGLYFNEQTNKAEIAFEPATKWRYSGLSYSLLQSIAINSEFVSPDNLLQSATAQYNLSNTSYNFSNNSAIALGHDRAGDKIKTHMWKRPNVSSSLHTTSSDYLKFMVNFLEEAKQDSSFAKLMLTPQVVVDSSKHLYWGLGWALAKNSDDTLFLHWGSNPGYKSLAIGSLMQEKVTVILTNGDNGLEVATELIPIIFGEQYSFLDFYMLHPDD